MLLKNQKRFNSAEFREDSIIAESTISYHNVNTDVAYVEYIYVRKTEIELQDLAISFDDLTLY